MASKLYRVKTLTLGEVSIEEGSEAKELEEAIAKGEEAVFDLFNEYEIGVDLDDAEVVGVEIIDADGKVIAKRGQELPGIVRV